MSNKHLLIVTGPQGSGNHLFSRILSQHPDVEGWEDLKKEYWVPSDIEPFAEYWRFPERLTIDKFANSQYFLANVSCPVYMDGTRIIPKIREVADRARDLSVQVTIAIIVRDKNINTVQQQRLMNGFSSLATAQEYYYDNILDSDHTVHFVDHEAFFLHGKHYLKWLSKIMNFPIAWDSDSVYDFIEKDANHKYITPIETHWLDEHIRAGRRPYKDRNIDDPANKIA
jgi:hypothetical protein